MKTTYGLGFLITILIALIDICFIWIGNWPIHITVGLWVVFVIDYLFGVVMLGKIIKHGHD